MAIHPTSIRPPVEVDAAGDLCVGPSGVHVWLVLGLYRIGWTADSIHKSLPSAALEDIEGVIDLYRSDRAGWDAYLVEVEREDDAVRMMMESAPGFRERQARLAGEAEAWRAARVPVPH